MGQKDKNVYYCKKRERNLTQKENKVYEAKINIIMHFFKIINTKPSSNVGVTFISFKKRTDLDSVLDLSLIISEYCEEKECYKDALEFSKRAILAEKKMRQLEGIG
ncbi:hypothetical protein ACGYLS_20075 [Bacillus subtilis]|uniref:hypothetical protein n=1 Tax=Bacillus subtilis TaxID=1423 RepID=UPI002DB9CF3B|nr:hypothetical protein [Bacillus subtilis]MEC1265979.1 hypothetical protein [Bacillus subtilis]